MGLSPGVIFCFAAAVFLTGALPVPVDAQGAAVFSDPFGYCAAVDTVDGPDERYIGPGIPDGVVAGLRRVLGLSDQVPQELMERSTVWRCMGGKVWACFVGANLPCTTKADESREPSRAMKEYCEANLAAEDIPAYVTGRETVYAWCCRNGAPEAFKRIVEPDPRGFFSNIWYKIEEQ